MSDARRARVPEHLAALRDALRDQDAPRLGEAAHKCCGMPSEFSTVAGDLAGTLEDRAAQGQLDEARPLVERLEAMVRRQAGEAGGRGGTDEH